MNKIQEPNENTTPYKVLEFLQKGATTGIEIVIELGILSYNTAIYELRKFGYIIETTLIITPDGKRYWVCILKE